MKRRPARCRARRSGCLNDGDSDSGTTNTLRARSDVGCASCNGARHAIGVDRCDTGIAGGPHQGHPVHRVAGLISRRRSELLSGGRPHGHRRGRDHNRADRRSDWGIAPSSAAAGGTMSADSRISILSVRIGGIKLGIKFPLISYSASPPSTTEPGGRSVQRRFRLRPFAVWLRL